MAKVAPSILSADFSNLEDDIKKVEAAGADMIHCDIMDGHFVPNITIGPLIVKALRKITKLPLDVHLMIENPDRYIPDFARAGADIICIHAEASKSLIEDIELIKANHKLAAVSLNPETPLDPILSVLDKVCMVLFMTVNPGFEGQKFMPEVLPKIKKLKSLIESRKLPARRSSKSEGGSVDIEVDGGINTATGKQAVKAGANVLVAGSAIFYAKDPAKVIKELKAL